MQLLDLFSPFISNVTWLAVILLAALGFWFIGKRIQLLRNFTLKHPVVSAFIDLIAAPVAILLLGTMARTVATEYGSADVSDVIADLMLLILTLAFAWCFARLIELFFYPNTEGTERPIYPACNADCCSPVSCLSELRFSYT